MEKKNPSVFEVLSSIDCTEHVETKKQGKGLSYLSWAWAWHYCKLNFPDASYTIYENQQGRPYFDDGRTAWVKTGVTIEGLEHIEYLPILDQAAHASLPLNAVTSWDMNKAIQRSLTKALARHGLGLYIYAGEDLPCGSDEDTDDKSNKKPGKKAAPVQAAPAAKKLPSQDPDLWNRWVVAIATGTPTKSGRDPFNAYLDNYKPSQDEIQRLQDDVFKYQLQNGIDPENPKPVNA